MMVLVASEGNFLISQDMVNSPETFITILKDGGNNILRRGW